MVESRFHHIDQGPLQERGTGLVVMFVVFGNEQGSLK